MTGQRSFDSRICHSTGMVESDIRSTPPTPKVTQKGAKAGLLTNRLQISFHLGEINVGQPASKSLESFCGHGSG